MFRPSFVHRLSATPVNTPAPAPLSTGPSQKKSNTRRNLMITVVVIVVAIKAIAAIVALGSNKNVNVTAVNLQIGYASSLASGFFGPSTQSLPGFTVGLDHSDHPSIERELLVAPRNLRRRQLECPRTRARGTGSLQGLHRELSKAF